MFGKILLVVSVAAVYALPRSSLEGVDPNSLSCDPEGLEFLLLPSFDDCTKFYMCTHGVEVEFTCPAGLWFDFELQGCTWSYATECKLRTEKEEEEEVDGEDGSGDGSGWEAEVVFHSGVLYEDVALDCADTSSKKLAGHRDDCQRYWHCNNGIAETAFCSDGLYFNPKTLQCDFEANVACVRDLHEEIGEEFIRY